MSQLAQMEMDANEKAADSAVLPATPDTLEPIDVEIEQRAKRKIDRNLVPIFCVLYAMSSLDRSNIGNANLTGFSADLGLINNQFGAAVSLVYVTYTTFEPVWAVLLKILTPRRLLTGTTVCWAALTIGTAFAKTFGHLVALRILLGVFEAAVIPCTTLYLSITYKRDEYATRQSWVFISSALSGAFGGLLAFGLQQVSAGGLHGWQWLYIVEGLISFCIVPVVWFWLPNETVLARWLTKEEKAVWALRQEHNRRVYDSRETFSWTAITAALKDPRLYLHCAAHFGLDCTLYSLTTFMPKIVAGLGFTTTVQAQLLTVPVYLIAAGSYLIQGRLSDRLNRRYPFVAFSLSCNVVGFIFLAVAPQPGVRYAGVFIAAIGLYSANSLHLLWCMDNFAGHYKRAFATSFTTMIGNTAGACIGFIFTTQSAPRYLQGIWVDMAMAFMALASITTIYIITLRTNKKKRELVAAGAPDDPSLGDRNPHYVWFL